MSEYVFFDEQEDGSTRPLRGFFPAHLTAWKKGTPYNGSVPFNAKYRIAPEAAEYEGEDESGKQKSASFMVGTELSANGAWLTPKPEKGEGYKNRKYKETLESLQFDLPKKEVNGKVLIGLPEVDEVELLGSPVMVEIDEVTNKNGKKYMNVISVRQWADGERIEVEETESEDDPF